jgi:hypothetical protein
MNYDRKRRLDGRECDLKCEICKERGTTGDVHEKLVGTGRRKTLSWNFITTPPSTFLSKNRSASEGRTLCTLQITRICKVKSAGGCMLVSTR